MPPETRYAKNGDVNIAYQVLGDGPLDLVVVHGWVQSFDEPIRVLPFGYVAHDEAADPSAPVATTVSVGPDGIVRAIAVTWGTSVSAWTYTVTYNDLGATPAFVAPANPRSLLKERMRAGEPPARLGGSE